MTLQIKSFDEYKSVYQRSVNDPEGFWAEQAETFTWKRKWDTLLDWDFKGPDVKWFKGGKLNITENCLDRHLPTRANQIAILWEPNNPEDAVRSFTYQQLYEEVCRTANALRA
ncbi:MAG: acetyl-coenzyme A synthetase, partial [Saprospiraceae bacterium]|nr:acetyl-coenzyme A synthetase [Saprospiraceae bacterium]